MTRLDRYILQQLVAAFGFFVLVFTGVIWLTQAVRLIDTVVASGQSAGSSSSSPPSCCRRSSSSCCRSPASAPRSTR